MKPIHSTRYKQLGLKISYYRKLGGFTQEQLAEKLGMPTSSIGAIEAPNVNRSISIDLLFDIADALGIPAYYLLKFDET